MIIKFRLGPQYTSEEQKDIYVLTDHPDSEDAKVVHFELNGSWTTANYRNESVENYFRNGSWVKIAEI
jgi:hypothetical protein